MRPLYLLSVDEPDEQSIVLVIRTREDGVTTGGLTLPANPLKSNEQDSCS
ncbi:MAG: hypothetical protein JWQ65_3115 [Devosia sp.]|nr:hypothetical protein [Devosia sp.]